MLERLAIRARSRTTKRPLAALLAAALTAALFIGGAQPEAVGLFADPWDKLVHAAVFFLLTLLLAEGFTLPAGMVAVVPLLVGAADELHQHFLLGRIGSVGDWLADLLGVLLALGVLRWRRSTGTSGPKFPGQAG